MGEDVEVAVLGAGIAGLVVGEGLRRAGREVVVLDASDRPGGVIRSETIAGAVVEWGPQSFLGAEALLAVVAALELPIDHASPAAKRRYVVRGGRLRDVPTSPPGLFKTDLLSAFGKLRILLEPLLHGRSEAADESVAAFAERHLGREACRYLVAPFVSGVYAGDPERLEARSAFPILADLERLHPSLLVAMMRRARGRGRSQAAKGFAVAGGNDRLAHALAGSLGPCLRLDSAVDAVRREGSQLVVVTSASEFRAREVVLALPAPAAARVVVAAAPELAALLAAIRYAAVRLVHVRVARTDVARELDGFGHLVPRGEGLRHLGCLWTSASYPHRAGADEALFAVFLGGALDPEAVALAPAAAIGLAWRELATLGVVRGAPRDAYCAPLPAMIAQYERGHGQRVAAATAAAGAVGMRLAGSAYHGVAVGEVVRTSQELVGRLGQPLTPRRDSADRA